jgi:hypothetical protein
MAGGGSEAWGDNIPLEQPSMPRGYERGTWAVMAGTTAY